MKPPDCSEERDSQNNNNSDIECVSISSQQDPSSTLDPINQIQDHEEGKIQPQDDKTMAATENKFFITEQDWKNLLDKVARLDEENKTKQQVIEDESRLRKELEKKISEQLESKISKLESKVTELSTFYTELNEIKEIIKPPQTKTQNTLNSSVTSWGANIHPEARKSYWSKLSFDLYQCPDYQNMTNAILKKMNELAYAERFHIEDYNLISSADACSTNLVLFPKYCGSSRFQSKEAVELVNKGKKIIFLVYRYGNKNDELQLGSEFSSCVKFEFFTSSLDSIKLVENERTERELQGLTTSVINNATTVAK
ncbi:hypothetical protein C9374_006864 [Naegleria lovaniensis]|uniref:Uncharacterized protein n=1 Tax=Naegleria lovaniensis TaxID=51637 RepID=A0AA88GYF1_NAELO|nr:uncharacterized protein C9374_006864 [Naegleria lovaniensis]KAG2393333.1 hypothetical protein C9374_006864 [Naegleria lovaniensis]